MAIRAAYEEKFVQVYSDYNSTNRKLGEFRKTVEKYKQGETISYLDTIRKDMGEQIRKCQEAWKELDKMLPQYDRVAGNEAHDKLDDIIWTLKDQFEDLEKCFSTTQEDYKKRNQRAEICSNIAGLAVIALLFAGVVFNPISR